MTSNIASDEAHIGTAETAIGRAGSAAPPPPPPPPPPTSRNGFGSSDKVSREGFKARYGGGRRDPWFQMYLAVA